MTTLKKPTPRFESEDEERDFWAKNDITDYIDLSEAKRANLPNLRPSAETVSVDLPAPLVEDIKALAHSRGVSHQALMRDFLAECAAREMRPISSPKIIRRKPRGRVHSLAAFRRRGRVRVRPAAVSRPPRMRRRRRKATP